MEARNEIVSFSRKEIGIAIFSCLVWIGLTIFGIILGVKYNSYFVLSYMTFCWMFMISEVIEKETLNAKSFQFLVKKKPYRNKLILRVLIAISAVVSIFNIIGFFSFIVVCWLYVELKKTLKNRKKESL